MKVLVLGAGGTGGVVGGRLHASGADVSFVVRERRREQLRQDGLRIESPHGNLQVQVKALLASELQPDFDLVILACKAYDLEAAIATVQRGVSGRTAILPLLNGLAHMERLNAVFGKERVLGGSIRMQVVLSPEGIVRQLNDWQTLTFGEQDGTVTPRVTALRDMLRPTGIEAQLSTQIARDMWMKMVHLSTVAGMTCLMRASVGEIARTPDGAALMVRLLEANAAVAAKEGYGPSDAFLREFRALFSNRDAPYTASMLRDIERKGPVEADHIIGFMLERARAHGLDDSLHTIVYTHLKAYEQRRAAGRL